MIPPCSRGVQNAAFEFQAGVDRWDTVLLGVAPDSLVHGLCTGNAVYSVVKLRKKELKKYPSNNPDKIW